MANDPNPTRTLLERLHGGDDSALGALLERHLDFVRRYVRGRVGPQLRSKDETQDLVQEAMLEVLRTGMRVHVADEDAFRRVLARIVENTIRDRWRWLNRECRDDDGVRALGSDTILNLDPPAHAITRPSQQVSADEEEAWVRLGLEFLDARDREVIWLREWEGLSFPALGARLGTSEEAARKRFDRALVKLAQRVGELRGGRVREVLAESDGDPA